MSFKIFIYKIPDNLLYLQYKRDLIKENSEFINSYKLEFYFDKIINNDKSIITEDINEATFYYIPQFYAPLWQGTAYLTGTVIWGSFTYSNSSNSWNITYSTNNPTSSSISGFSSWIFIFGFLSVITLFKRYSFKRDD